MASLGGLGEVLLHGSGGDDDDEGGRGTGYSWCTNFAWSSNISVYLSLSTLIHTTLHSAQKFGSSMFSTNPSKIERVTAFSSRLMMLAQCLDAGPPLALFIYNIFVEYAQQGARTPIISVYACTSHTLIGPVVLLYTC